MAKTKISEFDSNPSNNTDIDGINIAEGCAPSGINNAIRELMSQLKDQQTGASGDNFTVGGNLSVTGNSSVTGTSTFTGATTFNGAVVFSSTVNGSSLGNMASQNKNAVDITGGTIVGITDLAVADGGTGASSITANSVILGNGTSALSGNLVAPSTSGNVLTSNGTTWTSAENVKLGVGQTWTNMTSSRAFGSSYTNSTGKPIQISVNCETSNISSFELTVDGVIACSAFAYAASGNTARASLVAVIPNGSTYSANAISGTGGALRTWAELR